MAAKCQLACGVAPSSDPGHIRWLPRRVLAKIPELNRQSPEDGLPYAQ
jgi:hypothetical protein